MWVSNKFKLIRSCSLMAVFIIGMPDAQAAELRWSGFMTTGATVSDRSTPYARRVTNEPSLSSETVLGLNLAKDLSSKMSVAAQFLAREEEADSTVKADWAFLTYRPSESLEILAGKQKLPAWMVSSYLDVGTAYPWARPPEEVYSLFNLKFFTGLSVRYELKLGPTSLTLQPFAGESVIESAPNAPTNNSKIKGRKLFGVDLEWAWDRTLLRAAYNRANWDLNLGEAVQFGVRRFEVWSYGLSTRLRNFVLMGEYAATRDLDEAKYLRLADEVAAAAAAAGAAGDTEAASSLGARAMLLQTRLGGSKGYYATAGYVFDPVGVYVTYAVLNKLVQPGVVNDQSSAALGVNYDVTADSVLKLETKKIMVPKNSRGLFRVASLADEKLDGAMIYTVNYNLTF